MNPKLVTAFTVTAITVGTATMAHAQENSLTAGTFDAASMNMTRTAPDAMVLVVRVMELMFSSSEQVPFFCPISLSFPKRTAARIRSCASIGLLMEQCG